MDHLLVKSLIDDQGHHRHLVLTGGLQQPRIDFSEDKTLSVHHEDLGGNDADPIQMCEGRDQRRGFLHIVEEGSGRRMSQEGQRGGD